MNKSEEWDIIDVYTRKQAIEDGVLIDVSGSELVKNAGIKYPVAITSAVWHEYVEVPEGLEGEQDLNGRLWDLLWMFRNAAKASKPGGDTIFFKVIFLMLKDKKRVHETVTLKAVVGPGDNAEPVVTIMMPDED